MRRFIELSYKLDMKTILALRALKDNIHAIMTMEYAENQSPIMQGAEVRLATTGPVSIPREPVTVLRLEIDDEGCRDAEELAQAFNVLLGGKLVVPEDEIDITIHASGYLNEAQAKLAKSQGHRVVRLDDRNWIVAD